MASNSFIKRSELKNLKFWIQTCVPLEVQRAPLHPGRAHDLTTDTTFTIKKTASSRLSSHRSPPPGEKKNTYILPQSSLGSGEVKNIHTPLGFDVSGGGVVYVEENNALCA